MCPKLNNEPAEILELFDKRPATIKPGLSRIRQALEKLGNPGIDIPRIVVAGTNGKGTTSGMIWRLLSASGLRVGLFTSPHLVEFRERISVSGHDVQNDLLVEIIHEMRSQLPPELFAELTFFEINTLLAFLTFQRFKTDVNVLEIGMGGRLDCVNVYDPDVSVITSIGLDHMEYLGHTLGAIAREKAGIMRRGRPVVWCAADWVDSEADFAIVSQAENIGAQLIRATDPKNHELPKSLQTRPFFIQRNFQLAKLALVEFLRRSSLASGLRLPFENDLKLAELFDAPDAPWPVTFTGRFDLVTISKGGVAVRVLLDVCHNPHGAQALAMALGTSQFGGRDRRVNCFFSVLGDKDAAGIWSALKGNIKDVIAFRSSSNRAWVNLPKQMLDDGVVDLLGSFDVAWQQAIGRDTWRQHQPWLICGSVAMIGEVLAYWRNHGWKLDRVQLS